MNATACSVVGAEVMKGIQREKSPLTHLLGRQSIAMAGLVYGIQVDFGPSKLRLHVNPHRVTPQANA